MPSERRHNQIEILLVKNMFCHSCIPLLKDKLEQFGFQVLKIKLGEIHILQPEKKIPIETIQDMLSVYGFELIMSHEDRMVNEIKLAVIELIHHLNNVDSIVRKSDYLVEKTGLSYQYLSKIFAKHEKLTLEKYIIHQKIERIKQLIDTEEYTLSEISYMMDYSSVHYLSNQFKAITGMTVSQYKESGKSSRKGIDEI